MQSTFPALHIYSVPPSHISTLMNSTAILFAFATIHQRLPDPTSGARCSNDKGCNSFAHLETCHSGTTTEVLTNHHSLPERDDCFIGPPYCEEANVRERQAEGVESPLDQVQWANDTCENVSGEDSGGVVLTSIAAGHASENQRVVKGDVYPCPTPHCVKTYSSPARFRYHMEKGTCTTKDNNFIGRARPMKVFRDELRWGRCTRRTPLDASREPPSRTHAYALVNVAYLQITTGVSAEIVSRTVDSATTTFRTAQYPRDVDACDVYRADFLLREGEASRARAEHVRLWASLRGDNDELAGCCLPNLAPCAWRRRVRALGCGVPDVHAARADAELAGAASSTEVFRGCPGATGGIQCVLRCLRDCVGGVYGEGGASEQGLMHADYG
ncbi:hypothetical protein R3P38DRAFT_3214242 [Favolaschia claudopus]|uniref:C2H2-type domain-containing protein n=1 Tax=Favolaschia claudopus TaxID=2862362 RepID=A0AAW0AAI4_9AGAR